METLRILRGDHSVLILSPKPSFLELVSTAAQLQAATLNEIYFPEEDSVLLVPPIGTIGDYSKFEAFVSRLKPDLMMREFGKFGIPQPAGDGTAAAFDEHFTIAIRDRTEIVAAIPDSPPSTPRG
ncbi:MAG: hypothetical protein ACK5CW_11120 [Verrucomicrobiota bacterium]